MTQEHLSDVEMAVAVYLDTLVIPRHLDGNRAAQQDEFRDICGAVAQFAPRHGFGEWWQRVKSELKSAAKTRAWPLMSEVQTACRNVNARDRANNAAGAARDVEDVMVQMMADWFRRCRSQMPSCGRASRTMALIRLGVLADVSEARFYGFDLDPAEMERARYMPPCAAERQHDARVRADLAATRDRMAPVRDDVIAARERTIPQGSAA